jgi:hypothetical protein
MIFSVPAIAGPQFTSQHRSPRLASAPKSEAPRFRLLSITLAGVGCKFIVRCLMLFSRTSFRNPVLIFPTFLFPSIVDNRLIYNSTS